MIKVLFENKRKTISLKTLIYDLALYGPLSALLINLFESLLTLSKPKLHEIIFYTLIINICFIVYKLFHFFKIHVERIELNYNTKTVSVQQVRFINSSIKKEVQLEKAIISDIRHFPFMSFSFFNYFKIKDQQSCIKISTAGHGKKEIDLDEIYSEIKDIQKCI